MMIKFANKTNLRGVTKTLEEKENIQKDLSS